MPQFSLYLRKDKVLSHPKLLNGLVFSYIQSSAFQTENRRITFWQLWLFGPETFSALERNEPLFIITGKSYQYKLHVRRTLPAMLRYFSAQNVITFDRRIVFVWWEKQLRLGACASGKFNSKSYKKKVLQRRRGPQTTGFLNNIIVPTRPTVLL